MHICVKLKRQAEVGKDDDVEISARERERGWGIGDEGLLSWRSGKQTEKSVETDPGRGKIKVERKQKYEVV